MGTSFTKKSSESSLKLSENDLKTLLESTSFSEDQIYDWHNGFVKDCPNGRMNKKKFYETYSYLYPDGNSTNYCKRVFKVFDKNHSGEIEFADFMVCISLTTPGEVEKKLNNAFYIYDLDKNGFIDKHEMIKLVEAIFELMDLDDLNAGERVDEIMKKLDVNEDKFLSKDEFIKGCMEDEAIKKFLIPLN